MKFSLSFFLALCSFTLLFAQGNIKYRLQVTDKNHAPLAGMQVTAVETVSLVTTKVTTGADGYALLELSNGRKWNISVGAIPNATTVESMSNTNTQMNDIYPYDYNQYLRQKQQDPNRNSEGFELRNEIVLENEQLPEGKCMLSIALFGYKGEMLPGVKIEAVDVKNKIRYQSKTNRQGRAFFMLPNKTNYDIDVEQFKNFHYADFGDERKRHGLSLTYFPTVVTETVKGDTVFQDIDANARPSTERALISVNVYGGDKNGVGELTSLRSLSTKKVYFAKTNAQGRAFFLVPVAQIYMVDFEYERDADAVNVMNPKGLIMGSMSVNYRPDPRLQFPERYIPTPATLVLNNHNAFLRTTYEKPKNKPFQLKISPITKINKQSREALFKLTLAGSDSYGEGARLPMNVAFVLDKSGSMYSDDREGALRKSMSEIKELLYPNDEVNVILFDDEAVQVPKMADSKSLIQTVVDNYMPSGGTDIYKGLQLGVKSLKANFDAKKVNRIILLTDGYDGTPPEEITNFVELHYKEGIEFSAIGMGEGYNQSLLELIARKGNGELSHVANSESLPDAFSKQFGRYIAKDLKVEIYHDEKLIFTNLLGYPTQKVESKKVSFNIKNVGAGTNQIAFLKFKLEQPSAELEAKPITVKVSYFDVVQNKEVQIEEKIALQWTDETATEWLVSQEEKKLYAIAIMNQSLKLMAEAHVVGDDKAAKKAVENGIKQMREIYPDQEPDEVRAIFEEMKGYVETFGRIEKNQAKD